MLRGKRILIWKVLHGKRILTWQVLHGKTFGEAWKYLPKATPLGVASSSPDGGAPVIKLSPPNDLELGPTDALVSTLIEMELGRINTEHQNFIGQRQRVGRVIAKISAQVVREAASSFSPPETMLFSTALAHKRHTALQYLHALGT